MRKQPTHLQWPLTPSQVESLDEMLYELFKRVGTLSRVATPAVLAPNPLLVRGLFGRDSDDGDSSVGFPSFSLGLLQVAQFPALTGDVTTVAGSLVTIIGALKVTNAMLAGSIAAAKLIGTDIATVGTLTAGATGAGFTVALTTSTITGTLADARLSANVALLNAANSFTLINPLTTLAESWIGPSSTAGIYFKAGNVGIGTTAPGGKLEVKGAGTGRAVIDQWVSDTSYTGINLSGPLTATAYNMLSGIGDTNLYFNRPTGKNVYFTENNGTSQFTILNGGNVGIGVLGPTAVLHLKAGTATANTAPLQFTSGPRETVARAGVVEFLTDDFFATITTGAARKAFVLDDGTRLTSGKIPVATTNGRLVNLTASSAYTVTNPIIDRAYDEAATTLTKLANVLGTVISDLQAAGVLG